MFIKIFVKKFVPCSLVVVMLIAMTGCNEILNSIGNDAAMNNQGSNVLAIATFHESRYLEYAARKYEKLNEGVSIVINTYAGEERNIEKYSQIINTALMSGKGEDIIDASILAWTKLVDKNRLLDLNGKISLSYDDYYQNVTDAYLYNGKRYIIPLCFAFEALRFEKNAVENENTSNITLNSLVALADKYPEHMLFNGSGFGMGGKTLAYTLFGMNFNEFIDLKNKEANVDSEKFTSMLKNINSINERLVLREIGDVALIQQYLLYSPAMCNEGVIDYTDMFLLTDDNGNSQFMTVGFLPAVNANTPNNELAADFIQFLISEEMQSSAELMYNPINKKSSAEMAALTLADVRAGGYEPEGFDDSGLERNIAKFNELAGKLNVVEDSDYFISGFVRIEISRYFLGEVSAEQAAKNLHTRLNTYLKE